MERRPAPRLIVALIRYVQRPHDVLEALVLTSAGSLFGMMAIRMLAAWQAGRL